MASEPEKRPKPTRLALAVAIATTLAVVTSYLSASAQVIAARDNREGFRDLSVANTEQIEANQRLIRDDNLLTQAEFAEALGYVNLSIELRMKTFAYRLGYIDEFGNGTAAYGGDFQIARAAYINETYRPSRENLTAADIAFDRAAEAGARGLRFLLGTVLFAVCALLGLLGTQLEDKRIRLFITVFVTALLAGSVGYVLFTAFT